MKPQPERFNNLLRQFPIINLLHPRQQTSFVVAAIVLGVALGWFGMRFYDWPLWVAAALFLTILFVPGVVKWEADRRRYGLTAMGVSFLLVTQGFHTIEHLVQWVQYHILNRTMQASSGVLSPANSEWVHFTWNWLVVIVIISLVAGGVRNRWAWLLLIWACAHTLEHTYMFIRYQQVLGELKEFGITNIAAQGLPGILGEGGWLAQSEWTRGTWLSRLPGLATAVRLDIHFWWNMGEMSLLLLTSHMYLKSLFALPSARPSQSIPTDSVIA
jgi:hypothetical protein